LSFCLHRVFAAWWRSVLAGAGPVNPFPMRHRDRTFWVSGRLLPGVEPGPAQGQSGRSAMLPINQDAAIFIRRRQRAYFAAKVSDVSAGRRFSLRAPTWFARPARTGSRCRRRFSVRHRFSTMRSRGIANQDRRRQGLFSGLRGYSPVGRFLIRKDLVDDGKFKNDKRISGKVLK